MPKISEITGVKAAACVIFSSGESFPIEVNSQTAVGSLVPPKNIELFLETLIEM